MAKTNAKVIECGKCGRRMVVSSDATGGECWRCNSTPPRHGETVAEGKRPASRRLASFVRDECCNYDRRRGECLFEFLQDGDPKCRVCSGDRCGWFEQAVLPIAEQNPKAYSDAAKDYIAVARRWGFNEEAGRVCRSCGVDISPKKLYCPECLVRRRREQYRREKQRQRKVG